MGTDKALLPWPPLAEGSKALGQTFLSAAIQALDPWNDMVIVVVGNNEAALAPVVYANGGEVVRNPSPEGGQFSSLQIGLREVLNRGRDAATVTPVDRPPANSAPLQALKAAFEAAVGEGKWAVIPEYAGQHGHPIFVGREMIEAILRAPATANARDILHQHVERIKYVAVDDPMVTANVNTPEEYAALRGGL